MRFFVGQRVRIVRNLGLQMPAINRFTGMTGKIVKIYPPELSYQNKFSIRLDCISVALFMPEELEPILPEGMQPVSWESCLWQPEGEKVS